MDFSIDPANLVIAITTLLIVAFGSNARLDSDGATPSASIDLDPKKNRGGVVADRGVHVLKKSWSESKAGVV